MLVVISKCIPYFGDRGLVEALIGTIVIRSGLTFVFTIIFVYGSEIFPSNIRGTAVGVAYTCGKMIAI